MDWGCEQEADALTALARSLQRTRPDLEGLTREVGSLAAEALGASRPIEAERTLEQAARRLRAGWLGSVAAETARVLRSPTEREAERLARRRRDSYGYERDYQPDRLEDRCRGFFDATAPGWSAEHVLFSSGQAAMATALLQLAQGAAGKLRVAHVGAYFETRALATLACALTENAAAAATVIVEPVACNGRFATHDAARIASRMQDGQTLIVDETLSAPRTQAQAICAAARADIVVLRLVSGLKLLQQGLELANVGILSVFARRRDQATALAEGLRRARTLTGAGLRFVEALALEAPFFLDPDATGAYADRVFAHNASLAQAVTPGNRLFKPLGAAAEAAAPYCAFELAQDGGVEALEALAERIAREADARGLLFERGGSFGFRGHRYEVIEPESGEPPFLRVALGARAGWSCEGAIALLAEIAGGD